MVTDVLMNITSLLLTMGLPSIDESLDKLLVAMETFPKSAILGDTVGYARVIGLCLALCVGSYECWMMMLGRRAMDVMKLLRIVGLSISASLTAHGYVRSWPDRVKDWRQPPSRWQATRTRRWLPSN